ncbi:hypothetical protein C8Q79DRAFT_954830 [Trametes meyenii]|nr:hypothetical protein C8Q79DRAFT_954830 [Trametes meyenii]
MAPSGVPYPASLDLTSPDTAQSAQAGTTLRLYDLRTIRADDERCQDIDEYVTQLNASANAIKETVAYLQMIRNSRCVTHRLPPELLAYIFSYSNHTSPHNRDLITATHVCQTWRTIALNCPTLWNEILVTNVAKAKVFIERSKNTLLDIRFERTLALRDFGDLAYFIGRVRSLVIDVEDGRELLHVAIQLFGRCAPHLEKFHLLGDFAPGRGMTTLQDPVPLFHWIRPASQPSATPALRSLRLRPIALPWNSGAFQNLTVLDIATPGMAAPSEVQLLRIFMQCPELQEVHLDIALLTEPFMSPEDRAWDVQLPLLSSFSIEGPMPQHIAGLLSHLVLPTTTRFKLAPAPPPETHLVRPDEPIFPKDITRLPALASLDTVYLTDIVDGVRLTLYRTLEGLEPIVTVTLEIDPEDPVSLSLPPPILETAETLVIVTAEVRELVVDWENVFRRTVEVRTLRFVRPDSSLDPALAYLSQPVTDTLNPGPMCPKLESIGLVDAVLDAEYEQFLLDCVRERARDGGGLKDVKLVNVKAPSDDLVDRLSALGVIVEAVRMVDGS